LAFHFARFSYWAEPVTQFSPQQDDALLAVSRWLKDAKKGHAPQLFRLFGYAGTGKTTLARHIAEGVDGEVKFAAFTGKAAMMLRAKGCNDATTIHSLIYRSRTEDDTGEPSFSLNRQSDVKQADMVIIDECSMVDEELGRDLLSFGVPVLVLGDPAQLPPVKGGGFFTEVEPDVMLTEVHRQAADNPIVRLSMMVRAGERLTVGQYGDSRIMRRGDLGKEDMATLVLKADQVLVGRNKTRRDFNARMRELIGRTDVMPVAGDKVVCLRNNKTKGLLNGATFLVKAVGARKTGMVTMRLDPDDVSALNVKVSVLPEFFEGQEEGLPWQVRRESDEFDYGYALTVHKAQGSQWDHVVLFDESFAFREHRERWLYTGITRAAETLTIVV
jgi:ATP-dependent exoDNAse (exonuclease V) alpha subunit